MAPYQVLTRVGHAVDTVCPGQGKGDTVTTAVHDVVGDQTRVELTGHRFAITASNALADGSLVTAPAWPAHPEWMRQLLEVPGSRIEA